MGISSMIITSKNRESHLRSKNRFYIAGWVAAEFDEKPQRRPSDLSEGTQGLIKEHEDYMEGFCSQRANAHRLTLPPFSVSPMLKMTPGKAVDFDKHYKESVSG